METSTIETTFGVQTIDLLPPVRIESSVTSPSNVQTQIVFLNNMEHVGSVHIVQEN
jgi:hypothetical protein